MLAGGTAASGTRAGRVPRAGPLTRIRHAYHLGVGALTAAVGAFLLLRLTAWPPHEDEALVFFVSRQPLGDVFDTVVGERGGAPLHYLLAHLALSVDESLAALRSLSALFATASVPVIAALVARLAGRRTALLAALFAAASWSLLFHGIYARMYGLFLFASVLSCLLLLRAFERGTRGRWAAWAAGALALLATQPYGALVLAAQGIFTAALRLRGRPLPLTRPLTAAGAVLVLATPLWLTYAHLANRFDVGVGEGTRSGLGSPVDVLGYLWRVLGDFSAGWLAAAVPAGLVALLGLTALARRRPEAALFAGAIAAVPALALLATRSGSGLFLETRHLIFVLPFFAMALAAGVLAAARRSGRAGPTVIAAGAAGIVALQLAWGLDKTPWVYKGEPDVREKARSSAASWLAATSRADDVLFGYEPTYLDAERKGAPFGAIFVPRADPVLALETLQEAEEPLGRGVWVLDASDHLDRSLARLTIPERSPSDAYEARAFGPFLVLRTREPTGSVRDFLLATLEVQTLSSELGIGDAGLNLATAERALELDREGG